MSTTACDDQFAPDADQPIETSAQDTRLVSGQQEEVFNKRALLTEAADALDHYANELALSETVGGDTSRWGDDDARQQYEREKDLAARLRAAAVAQPPSGQSAAPAEHKRGHIDDDAVNHFAVAMKEKLAQARTKGRSGWHECDPASLSLMLREHVEKGDPLDVANFCMFLWSLGQPIAAEPSLRGWLDASRGIATAPAPSGAVAAVSPEMGKAFPDQSTADPVTKARRVLTKLADGKDYTFFFDDGFPRAEMLAQAATATLAVLDALATPVAAQPQGNDARYLLEDDYHALHRFIETTEDDEGYDIGKDAVRRLAELGVVQSLGFGRYGVTMFGYYAHDLFWHQNPALPLITNADRDARHRAKIRERAMSPATGAGKVS